MINGIYNMNERGRKITVKRSLDEIKITNELLILYIVVNVKLYIQILKNIFSLLT